MCGYCDILNIDKEVDPPTPFDEKRNTYVMALI